MLEKGWKFLIKFNQLTGPSNWWKFSQNCVGLNQSPINLESSKAIVVKTPGIKLTYFTKKVSSIQVISIFPFFHESFI